MILRDISNDIFKDIGRLIAKVGRRSFTEAVAENFNERLRVMADAFLADVQTGIFAKDLKQLLDEGEKLYLLDIRTKNDYDNSHIPGAVNIEFSQLFKRVNLDKLPRDGTDIIIICYSGHKASQACIILNMLGFSSWVLRFGMIGWCEVTKEKVWSASDLQNIHGAGYPLDTL